MSDGQSGRLTDSRTLARYVALVVRTARWRAALVVALAIAVALLEGVGVLLLPSVLRLAGVDGANGPLGRVAGVVNRALGALHVAPSLMVLLLLFAASVVARAMVERASIVSSMRLQEELLLSLRTRLHDAIVHSRWDHLSRLRAADLVHVLTGELERQATAPTRLVALLTGVLLSLVYLVIALRLSAPTTVVVLLAGAIVVGVLRRTRRAARLAGDAVDEHTNALFRTAAEQVEGAKTTKICGAEEQSREAFRARGGAVSRANVDCEGLFANARMAFDVGAVAVLCVAAYVGIGLFALPAASILVLLYVFTRLTPRLAAVQGAYQGVVIVMPSFRRAMRTIETCEAGAERKTATARSAPIVMRRGVDLVDVHFRYGAPVDGTDGEPERAPALRGVSLHIAAGRTTAIVGPSGAGKSTIAELVLGLLTPQRGRVEIDGVPLTPDVTAAWRRTIGYVAQDTFLFHDTIRANLLWGSADASDAELRDALTLASAEFVFRLPDGMDTIVGHRGTELSGGERQRIALARALLRRPTLLVLDEATSALDGDNERRILRAVRALHGRITVILVTHRGDALRIADHAYVVEEGAVVDAGRGVELLARRRRVGRLAATAR